MFYTIYKITNKSNGRFYIGSHKTRQLDDNYMGSGTYIKKAINKYGVENFEKEILYVFDNQESMYEKEAEIVNERFISEENTYNLNVGGFGGWNYVNDMKLNNRNHEHTPQKISATLKKYYESSERREFLSNTIKKSYNDGTRTATSGPEHMREMSKKAQTTEAIEKRNNTRKLIKFQVGERNSQFGSRWIYNTKTLEIKKLRYGEPLHSGWEYGKGPKKLKKEKSKSKKSSTLKRYSEEQKSKYRVILDYYRDNDINQRDLSTLFNVGVNMYVIFERYFKDEYKEIVEMKRKSEKK